MTTALDEGVEAVREAVRTKARLRPFGGGSKPAMSGWGNLPTEAISGVLEYDPGEYTFTALAGTPIREVQDLLARHGQVLPFDPPLVEAGATLGGTVAGGLSGPGRQRYGGVRDFLLGVSFVDGRGELLRGGAKVVKNAAGFDIPKLMVGALGEFGVLIELTFKVFPRPEASATLVAELASLPAALAAASRLAGGPFEVACLDFTPSGRLLVRIAGWSDALDAHLERLSAAVDADGEILEGDADEDLWREAREFAWLPDAHPLVKVPLNPARIEAFDAALGALHAEVPRRYSVGGNVAWLGWPDTLEREALRELLTGQALAGVAVTGSWRRPLLGHRPGAAVVERLRAVFDPLGKFVSTPGEPSDGGDDRGETPDARADMHHDPREES